MDVANLEFKKPEMTNLMVLLFEKWSLIGFSGFLLSVFSLLAGAQLPDATGLSGLAIVGIALWQKWREDKRKQEKHDVLIRMINKMVDKEIEVDESILKEFMEKIK